MNKAVFVLLLIGMYPVSSMGDIPAPPPSLSGVRFEQKIGQSVALDTRFLDENSQPTSIATYFNRLPVIMVFSYFKCPNLCTTVLNGLAGSLAQLPDTLGKDYRLLSVTIDPSEKPPLALAKSRSYVARLGDVHLPWHFLTGQEAQIRRLTNSVGFHYQLDPISKEYSHPSGFVIVSPQGKISQYFFGVEFDAGKIHRALAQASAGKSGSWIDDVLLYCFHYDPNLTRNGPLIMRAIRIAGTISVIGLAVFLGFLFFGRRKDGLQ